MDPTDDDGASFAARVKVISAITILVVVIVLADPLRLFNRAADNTLAGMLLGCFLLLVGIDAGDRLLRRK